MTDLQYPLKVITLVCAGDDERDEGKTMDGEGVVKKEKKSDSIKFVPIIASSTFSFLSL